MTLYKGPDGYWRGDFRFKGFERLHISMRTTKKAEAEPRYQAVRRFFREKRPELVAQVRAGELTPERAETMVRHQEPLVPVASARSGDLASEYRTLNAVIEAYLNWTEANPNRTKATFQTARAQLRRFAAFVFAGVPTGERALEEITSVLVEAYQKSLIDAETPVNTRAAYMRRLSALFNWMQRQEQRRALEGKRVPRTIYSPVDPETQERGVHRRDRWLLEAEAERLFAAAPAQLQAFIGCGLLAGLRIGEVLHLRPAIDIDLTLGTLTIQKQPTWKPKTQRSCRVVPIVAPLKALLETHLARYANEHWLLPGIENPTQPFDYKMFWDHFTETVRDAELTPGRTDPRGVTFHTLRHTFASWLVMRGVDLYTVAQLLGDSLQMVEATYAHLAPDFKARAVERLVGAVTIPVAAHSVGLPVLLPVNQGKSHA